MANVNWENLTNLSHLDIFFSQKNQFSMGSTIILSKLNQPSLRFIQLANIFIDERRLETALNRVVFQIAHFLLDGAISRVAFEYIFEMQRKT